MSYLPTISQTSPSDSKFTVQKSSVADAAFHGSGNGTSYLGIGILGGIVTAIAVITLFPVAAVVASIALQVGLGTGALLFIASFFAAKFLVLPLAIAGGCATAVGVAVVSSVARCVLGILAKAVAQEQRTRGYAVRYQSNI